MRKKYISGLVASLLVLAGLTAFESNSYAANLPVVKIISPAMNPANDTFAADGLKQWYAEGGHSYFKYVGAGSTITITYLVTSDGTSPMVGKTINFQVNAPYSGSKATWEVNGKSAGPSQDSATGWGLQVTGTTDSEGKVSFTIKNTDTAANAESIPTSETQPRPANGRLHGSMKAVIDGLTDLQQIEDQVAFDITKAPAEVIPSASSTTPTPTATPTATATPTPTPTVAPKLVPSMRLVSPAYSSANSVDTTGDIAQWYSAKTKAWYTYVQAGTTLTLKYLVTKDGTTPAANTEVTLQVNAPYSASKANWISGSTKISAPTTDSASGADLKATTNAAGEVTFTIKNTDTAGYEVAPATANAAAPKSRLYGTFKPVITGYGDKEADVDLVTFDVYAPSKPVVKATTITCIKGKVSKKVTAVNPKCPVGYKKK
jgi:hypothetical protein